MILVDTSVWVDYFNDYASLEADFLTLCIAEARPIVIAGLVLTEILQGMRDEVSARRVREVLSAFVLAPELSRADYERAAEIHRVCRARGKTPRSAIDCLIAQLCLRNGYGLLSRDRDFGAIARCFELECIAPPPEVREQAAHYHGGGLTVGPALTPPAASAARRSSRA